FMARLREAVGLRDLRKQPGGAGAKAARAALPVFKQYRERDGRFYFKLVDAHGRLLLQSAGFDVPRDAAQAMALLRQRGSAALADAGAGLQAADGVSPREITAVLQQLADATK
ncbi:MAG: tryptophan--tRNA ligase, partial [Rhodoferax sp.]